MRGNELLNKMELVDPAYFKSAEESPSPRKHPRWVRYGLAAACLCAVLLLSLWGVAATDNAFLVKAYALELASGGTVELKEMDLLEPYDIWGGHFDGENFYVNVGLRYDGNNIASVDFVTEEGFFAKQYIGSLSIEENVPQLYVGPENRLAVYGTEFERAGSAITLNEETMTDDLLLFWGTQAAGIEDVPKHIDIQAVATFRDGRTQELTIPLDLSGMGAAVFTVSEEELQHAEDHRAYYMNLPLEKCELLEETVKVVTDVYEVNAGTCTDLIPIDSWMEFDEDGIWRGGMRGDLTDSGYEVYIPVIKRDADGVYTGMIYRVPQALHYAEK